MKNENCYIVKKENGEKEETPLREFLDYLIEHKRINEHLKSNFIEYPEDLVFLLNAEEKHLGRKYIVKHKEMKTIRNCYIVKIERGKEEETPLREFFDYLVENKGFNENTKLYFLLFPEDLVYILNDVEKSFGVKYRLKYQ